MTAPLRINSIVQTKKQYTPFYLNSKPQSGTTSIMMRIYDSQFSNGRFVYSTKEKIGPANWDEATGKAKKGFEHINSRLAEIYSQAASFISLNRRFLTKEVLKKHLDSGRPQEVTIEKPKTFLQQWMIYLEIAQGNVTRRTYWGYKRSYEVFEAFLKEKQMLNLLPMQFDNNTYQRFRSYLKQKYPSENSAAKVIKHLKMAINSGIKIGMDDEDISFYETAGIKIALTEEQLKKLPLLNLNEALGRIRDMLIVQCHTGVRVSDLFRLDKNIVNGRFEIQQQKTKILTQIPILAPVKAILQKYNNRLPYMSDVKYNEGLKLVYKALDEKSTMQVRKGETYENKPTWKLFSSHHAIRTFITLSAEKGIPIASIAKIVGKTIQVITKNYLVERQDIAEKEMIEKWAA